jgi:hypothetical protein
MSSLVPVCLSEGAPEAEMAEWVKREFGKGVIDRAGESLIPWWLGKVKIDRERTDAFVVVENWRTSHAMPLLTFRMGLTNRARRADPTAIIAQRLKRFTSLMDKLVREPSMKLSQMQDLGGCRAILADVAVVDRVLETYRGSGTLFDSEGSLKVYDYLRNPKADGYRGVHVVGRYAPRIEKNEPWNGHRIEIQLRSRLQHAFATAVETVTTFTREPLKFGAGPNEWRRFFSLMGSALAHREGTVPVPGTPASEAELRDELRDLTKRLRVQNRLRGFASALKQLPKRNTARAKWLLLVLDLAANTIKVTGYANRKKAQATVASIEQSGRRGDVDAVLVWVPSVRELRSAYPNYYADTTAFVDALARALA